MLFPDHVDDDIHVLDERFEKDLVRSIAGGIPSNSVPDKQLPNGAACIVG